MSSATSKRTKAAEAARAAEAAEAAEAASGLGTDCALVLGLVIDAGARGVYGAGDAYEALAKLARVSRALYEAVCDARKAAASRIIRALRAKPDFEAGYSHELAKLKPLIPRVSYTELEELLLDSGASSYNFYVWALLRLAHAHLACTAAPLTPQTYDDFTDALFPLVGDDDCAEADAIIASFLEETGLLRYATADERENMEWALRPASFALQYNDARGAAPPFVRGLARLVALVAPVARGD